MYRHPSVAPQARGRAITGHSTAITGSPAELHFFSNGTAARCIPQVPQAQRPLQPEGTSTVEGLCLPAAVEVRVAGL